MSESAKEGKGDLKIKSTKLFLRQARMSSEEEVEGQSRLCASCKVVFFWLGRPAHQQSALPVFIFRLFQDDRIFAHVRG